MVLYGTTDATDRLSLGQDGISKSHVRTRGALFRGCGRFFSGPSPES